MASKREFILNTFEKMVINASRCGDYLVMGTCFFDDKVSNQKINQEIVLNAFKILQKRHEILRAYLKVEESSMFFVPHEQDVSEKIIFEWLDLTQEAVDRDMLHNESAKFNSKLFSHGNKELLWRAQVIQYTENSQVKYILNFVFFGIADGMYSSSILVETVGIINQLLSGEKIDEKVLEITENMNILCEKRGLWKESHKETVKKVNQSDLARFNLSPSLRTGEFGFQLDMFYLNEQVSNKIMLVSKKNKCRLSSFFCTAAFYAFKALYDENGLEFPKRVSTELPVCLRMRYKPALDFNECRLHTTMVLISTEDGRFGEYNDFWKDCQYLQEVIMVNTSSETGTLFSLSHSEELDEYNKTFSKSESLDEVLKVLSEQGVMSDLSISNLGAYVNDNVKEIPGKFSVHEIYCTDPVNSNPTISVGFITHLIFWKDKMMIQFGANKCVIGSKYFKRFKQIFVELVHEKIAD